LLVYTYNKLIICEKGLNIQPSVFGIVLAIEISFKGSRRKAG